MTSTSSNPTFFSGKITLSNTMNLADHMFIASIDNNTFDEKDYFSGIENDIKHNVFSSHQLQFIMKIAKASPRFESICKQLKYANLWSACYSNIEKMTAFLQGITTHIYSHNDSKVVTFDLLRGSHLFHESQKMKIGMTKSFSDEEIYLLKQAITYPSIHAIQRYNSYLYYKIENNLMDKDSNETKVSLFTEIINNCKKMLELYGSFAYMMLAEAYFQYAQVENIEGDSHRAELLVEAAVKSCTFAHDYLDQSQFSIHNASYGLGLKKSNTLNIDSPDDAKTFLLNQNKVSKPL